MEVEVRIDIINNQEQFHSLYHHAVFAMKNSFIRYYFDGSDWSGVFVFKDDNAALMFRLKWGNVCR